MKMARATQEDLDAALLLCGMLCDVFETGRYPRGMDGEYDDEEEEEFFDETRPVHLAALWERLNDAMNKSPGGLRRVIGGMYVLCDPQNRVIHPESDHLMLHPALRYVDEPAAESVDVVAEQQAAEAAENREEGL